MTKLTASDAEADDFFGSSVAVSGDTALVGASQEDEVDINAGAAYVFEATVVDSDGDGVLDVDDSCPGTAVGAVVDANGCSDAQVDRNGDGFCDPGAPSAGPSGCTGSDACPDEDSTGFDADNDGCIDGIQGLSVLIDTLFDEGVIDSTMLTSLHAKIDAALAKLEKDQVCTAIKQLDALKGQIEAQTGKFISEDAAPELLQYITNAQTFLVIASGVGSC